jgi:hypothetical protein
MPMTKNFAAVSALLFFLLGCSASGPRFPDTPYAKQAVPTDKARIIFFRPDDSQAGGRWAHLDIDGAPVGKLARERFLVVDTVPGEREIATDEGERKARFVVTMYVEAGQTYYLQVSRMAESKKYQATGIFALVGDLIAPLLKDDQPPFELEPVFAGRAMKMLEVLELAE